jgi:hypothetical protein
MATYCAAVTLPWQSRLMKFKARKSFKPRRNTMTKISKFTSFAVASAIAAASLLPHAAFAQTTDAIQMSPSSPTMNNTGQPASEGTRNIPASNDPMSVEAGPGYGRIAAASPVTVQRIDALAMNEASRLENISADQLAATQQEIAANPGLAAELRAKGVQINDVVDVISFPNGTSLVYVR